MARTKNFRQKANSIKTESLSTETHRVGFRLELNVHRVTEKLIEFGVDMRETKMISYKINPITYSNEARAMATVVNV